MENGNKNKFVLGILIGILITIIIGLTSFIIYDKVLSNDNNKVESNENNDKEDLKEISSSELETILNKIDVYNNTFAKSYPINDLSNFANNMSNQDKLRFLTSSVDGNKDNISINQLNNTVSKYFNNNFTYKNEDITCFTNLHLQYEYNNGNYKNIDLGHGTESVLMNKTFYIDGSYNEDNGVYNINTKILYAGYCDDICVITKFYSDNNLEKLVYEKENYDDPEEYSDVYNKVKDKLPITTYKFVKNSSNELILQSVTIK